MRENEDKYWRIAWVVRWLLGVIAPGAILAISGLTGEWRDSALYAGVFSMLAQAVSTLTLRRVGYQWGAELPNLLFWWAVPLGVALWGAGLSPFMAISAGVSVVAAGAIGLFCRDMVALAAIVLGVLATWSFTLVGNFGTWPAAALAASASGLSAAVAYYVGRVAQGYGRRPPVPISLYIAATPFGLLLRGVGMDWNTATYLAFVVAAAGVVVDITIPKNYDNDEY